MLISAWNKQMHAKKHNDYFLVMKKTKTGRLNVSQPVSVSLPYYNEVQLK